MAGDITGQDIEVGRNPHPGRKYASWRIDAPCDRLIVSHRVMTFDVNREVT